MGNKGYGRYWRLTSKGNTGISRGSGNKGKSLSHLQISFPTKEATICSSPPGTSYIILLCIAKKLPKHRFCFEICRRM